MHILVAQKASSDVKTPTMPNPGKRTHDQTAGSGGTLSPNKQKTNGSNGGGGGANKRAATGDSQGHPPKKKLKNGLSSASPPQPKNTVAMLNELRQGLLYTLEGQSGPVHAPIFTMTVEVSHVKKLTFTLFFVSFCGSHTCTPKTHGYHSNFEQKVSRQINRTINCGVLI